MHAYNFCVLTCCLYRNESYESRIQLAILDHNQHTKRNKRLNKKGGIIYQRKYRKQSKKWDTTPLLEKKYKYIPELILAISKQRERSSANLKQKTTRPSSHPSRIQKTIAHRPPVDTCELVASKRSRFTEV